MGKGYLQVQLFLGYHVSPVKGAKVLIQDKNGNILYNLTTDLNGNTDIIPLEAPTINADNSTVPPYALYDIVVPRYNGLKKAIVHNVQIYDGQTTLEPLQMQVADDSLPLEANLEEVFIPEVKPVSSCPPGPCNSYASNWENTIKKAINTIVIGNEVAIPEYITVHLGSPNDTNAENYRLPFIDYVKNVATHEIYSTWQEEAIAANILAQMSFTLNRIFTLWYPTKAGDFDITNDLRFDQQFVKNGTIDKKISLIVDYLFTTFLRRQGRKEPFFASYCDGYVASCDGLLQCGSQDLACKGYSTIDILRYYYPKDIQIVKSNNTGYAIGRYPGSPLRINNPSTGQPSVGEDVLRMQIFLNRLSGNWWIDPIPPDKLNGVFGPETEKAVKMFQTSQGLPSDGIIGSVTWYFITQRYTAAVQLGELTSEGIRIGIGKTPPNVTIKLTPSPNETRGEYVVELQFLLDFISLYYNNISTVIQNGVFRKDTERGVKEFQKEFLLTQDGVVGPGTWNKLYEVYDKLITTIVPPAPPDNIPIVPPQGRPFPGTTLKIGSSGEDVLYMQNCLNAIAIVYPSIPTLVPDGKFGTATGLSVKKFQEIFGLPVNGQIDLLTWNKITEVYYSLDTNAIPTFPGDLTIGSSGEAVTFVQKCLNGIGNVFLVIPPLTADGKFGPATAGAVKEFQALFGIPVTGVVNRETWDKIIYVYKTKPDVVSPGFPGTNLSLKNNSRGANVLLMQKYLNAINAVYPSVPRVTADGIFGPKTDEAVKAFQKQFGLTSDGVIGRMTWNKIVSIYNLTLMYSNQNTVGISSQGMNCKPQISPISPIINPLILMLMFNSPNRFNPMGRFR